MHVHAALQITSKPKFNNRCGGNYEYKEEIEDGMQFKGEGKVEDN